MTKLQVCTIDLETFWATDHTLTKMSAITYAMHERTEIISCSFKFGEEDTECYFGEDRVAQVCDAVDWSEYIVLGHNLSEFDVLIMAWRLNIRPKFWGCTLAMARPHHAKTVGLSLRALAAHYGLGIKDDTVLHQTKGRNLAEFSTTELRRMRKYNIKDVDQCYGLFKRLHPLTPPIEMFMIDATIRMLVEPVFELDVRLLHNTHMQESARKREMLRALGEQLAGDIPGNMASAILTGESFAGLTEDGLREQLSSAAKFKRMLEMLNVDVPMKDSPSTPGKMIPALAKTDEGFLALLEDDNPVVATAAEARLDVKSTMLQTRIDKFLTAANSEPRGMLPIPLRYCGADTTWRWSGWAYNPQNLPRINPDEPKPSDALRKSIRAPKGKAIVVVDQAGIELRVNHFLWKVPSSMQMYQDDPEHADLYKDFAANSLYNISIDEVDKAQRQVGKVSHLGLGFGAAWRAFQKVAKILAKIDLSDQECQRIVSAWRTAYPEIVEGWDACNLALPGIARGYFGSPIDPWGMITPEPGGLRTPGGFISYPNLRKEVNAKTGRRDWVYGRGRRIAKIYGGKVDENLVQHLARLVIRDNLYDVYKATGYRPGLVVHDELVYVVPEDQADDMLYEVNAAMRVSPKWWPELVTWSEGGISDTYGGAK